MQAGSGNAAEAEVFDLDEAIDAVFGALAAHAGFLDAAEGRFCRGNQPLVDTDHAVLQLFGDPPDAGNIAAVEIGGEPVGRSEEHTSELQSLMRISYAVFCLKKTNRKKTRQTYGRYSE